MARGSKKDGFHRPFADKLEPLARAKREPGRSLFAAAARRSSPSSPSAPRSEPAPPTDEELFLSAVAGTQPLADRRPRVSAPPVTQPPPRRPDDAEVMAALADLVAGHGPFDISDGDEFIEGIAEGLDRRLLRRLRRGEFSVQAHLDLHGLTRDEARDAVARFVEESRRASRRCVLIVHGRGLHSKEQIPVLKQAVRSWLERGQIARSVLAFSTARPHDGGTGAVYVLLRR